MLKLNNTLFNINDSLEIVSNKLVIAFNDIFPFVLEEDDYGNTILGRIISAHRTLIYKNGLDCFLEVVIKDVNKEIINKEFRYKILQVNEKVYLLSMTIY